MLKYAVAPHRECGGRFSAIDKREFQCQVLAILIDG